MEYIHPDRLTLQFERGLGEFSIKADELFDAYLDNISYGLTKNFAEYKKEREKRN